MLEIRENINLKNYNTFGINVKAKYSCILRNQKDLTDLTKSSIFKENKRLIIGGGSNLLFLNDFDGLVIFPEFRGMRITRNDDDSIVIEVGSGENWHNFVQLMVYNNYSGLENLALIPGKVGAAPVQNIGAYGIEQKDYFHSLNYFNLIDLKTAKLSSKQCRFGYRDSIFKNELKDQFIILNVSYKLIKRSKLNLTYKALLDELNKTDNKSITPQTVFQTVCKIRNEKLPSPDIIGNAGSFFKNPIIKSSIYDDLVNRYPDLPKYPIDSDNVKTSAAWLIEQCGWKGKRIGDAGVYDKHSLILVNYGNATGLELFDLSQEIIRTVNSKFGITLEREVQIIS